MKWCIFDTSRFNRLPIKVVDKMNNTFNLWLLAEGYIYKKEEPVRTHKETICSMKTRSRSWVYWTQILFKMCQHQTKNTPVLVIRGSDRVTDNSSSAQTWYCNKPLVVLIKARHIWRTEVITPPVLYRKYYYDNCFQKSRTHYLNRHLSSTKI